MGEYKSKHTGLTVDNAVDKIPTTNPTADSVIVLNASGAPSYKAVADLGGGDVTAAGNNVFTGVNTFGSSIGKLITISNNSGISIDSSYSSGTIMEMPGGFIHFGGFTNASYYAADYVLIQSGEGGGSIRIEPDPANYRIQVQTTSYDNKVGNVSIPYNVSGVIAFKDDIKIKSATLSGTTLDITLG